MSTEDCIIIPLASNRVATVDLIDSDLRSITWVASRSGNTMYVSSTRKAGIRRVQLHRVILERMIGRSLLRSEYTDHIDGNGLNNRRSNLRIATPAQNIANTRRHKDNSSGYKGVSYRKDTGRWNARIFHKGKQHNLGGFSTPKEAHEAYCQKALELNGEFANSGDT